MRLRNKPWAQDKLDAYPNYVPQDATQLKGQWALRFQNPKQPIHIEVGSGKGRFIIEMAKAHPEINYIAIELQTSVIVSILDKQIDEQLPNVQILHADGRHLSEYFETNEISRIYLNFSDPWPKKRHEKRRLTSSAFIQEYRTILKPDGEIHFKTDNQGLFEYSLASFSQNNLTLQQVWLDLHQSDFQDNIMTEYEEKFSNRGQRIYRVEAQFNKPNN